MRHPKKQNGKAHNMKTTRFESIARYCHLALVLTVAGGAMAVLNAAESAKGGGARLLEVTQRPAYAKVEPNTSSPMSCPMCKDQTVRQTDLSARGAVKPVVASVNHGCQGCGTDWVVTGHGKAKSRTAVHVCQDCGGANLACCATSKAATGATKGMEKKIEVAPLK